MTKYYCSKCEIFHFRGKLFQEHKKFSKKISNSEFFKIKFIKSWKNYSKKEHKKAYGSRK